MKKLQILRGFVLGAIGIMIPLYLMNYLLVNDVKSYTRIMFNELYHQDNIDVLFLGSSHSYRSINPQIIDEMWDKNTFNGGTSSQTLDGSYVILKEAVKYNKIDKVYLEVFYTMMGNTYSQRTEITPVYIISDYLRPSIDKYVYMLTAIPKEHYVEGFVKCRRSWKKIFQKDYINDLVMMKQTDAYKKYEYVGYENEGYIGKGYVGNYTKVGKGAFIYEGDFVPVRDNRWSEDDIRYLKKIKKICEDNDIELVLYSAPISDFRLCNVANYDNYVRQVNDLAIDLGVEYYDFNLCNSETLALNEEHFYDDNHLNLAGGEIFSKCFAVVMTDDNKEKYFYDSYQEKMEGMNAVLLGTIVKKNEDILEIQAVHNKEMDINYLIEVVNGAETRNYFGKGDMVEISIQEGDESVSIKFYDSENINILYTEYKLQ